MLDSPPFRIGWTHVVAWSAIICATIPLAPTIRDLVEAAAGRNAFTYGTIAAVAAAFAVVFASLRGRRIPASGRVWLAAVGAVYAIYAWELRAIPEEGVHLLQYGVLGVLAFLALGRRTHDLTIYASATLIGAVVGIVDEGLQWVAPNRHWTLGDIRINVAGAALSQVAIAKGLRPGFVRKTIEPAGVRRACRFAAAAVVLLAATLLNTPQRIEWYATRVPGLEFLLTNESVMFEYGYLYRDDEAGVFRSRLSPSALRETDARRGREAARILDEYPDALYKEFLNTYTPVSDPFVHEARVHLFSRDKHVRLTREPSLPPSEQGWHATVAWRENRILEKYFPSTLALSSQTLSAADAAMLESVRVPWERVPPEERESWVSRTLVTSFREAEIMAALAVVLAALWLIERMAARREATLSERRSREAVRA